MNAMLAIEKMLEESQWFRTEVLCNSVKHSAQA